MNWHTRYTQQASWTRNLREYLFEKIGLENTQRVLEVGCGTGAILSQIQATTVHGLDIQLASLMDAKGYAPNASLTCGDALALPYTDDIFDVVLCHFLLLWVSNPLEALLEMKHVTKRNGHILALAEPDYSARVDKPEELSVLGRWQAESLLRQGADPAFGGRLAELFFQSGIKLVETGAIESHGYDAPSLAEWKLEWAVLENDLAGIVSTEEIRRLKKIDQAAWIDGDRVLHVPTYFAWGQI